MTERAERPIQTGLKGFINQTEMVAFSGFCRTLAWVFAVVLFSSTACIILLRDSEKYMTWGFQLALAVIGGLLGASGIGAFNTKTVRESAEEYAPVAKAKAEAHIAGAAAAAVIKKKMLDDKAAREPVTRERSAMAKIDNAKKVIVTDDERGTE